MVKRNTAQINTLTHEVECPGCGRTEPMPKLPMEVRDWLAYLKIFQRAHRRCAAANEAGTE
jgi:hypothetical protein